MNTLHSFLAVLLLLPSTAASNSNDSRRKECLPGWMKLGSFCYKQPIGSERLNYRQAVDQCWDAHGDLPVLKHADDANAFYQYCKENRLDAWIGLELEARPAGGPGTAWLIWRNGDRFRQLDQTSLHNSYRGMAIDLRQPDEDRTLMRRVALNGTQVVVCQRKPEEENTFDVRSRCSEEVEMTTESMRALADTTVNPAACASELLSYFDSHVPNQQFSDCTEYWLIVHKRTIELWLQRPACLTRTPVRQESFPEARQRIQPRHAEGGSKDPG